MCGRYTSTSSPAELSEMFAVDEVRAEELPLRYNVAPTQDVYAVAERRPREEGETPRRQLGSFRWGLVPWWAKGPSVGSRMINARAEGIATRSAYKRALARRRCIIPADGFYEWQVRAGEAGKPRKLPWLVRHRDGSPLAFAGLWESWHDPDDPEGPPLRTCVIVTTAANDLLAPIHDRMPVVLPPDVWDRWLDTSNQDPAAILGLLAPAPSDGFEIYPVSTKVNTVANEGPELVAPAPPA